MDKEFYKKMAIFMKANFLMIKLKVEVRWVIRVVVFMKENGDKDRNKGRGLWDGVMLLYVNNYSMKVSGEVISRMGLGAWYGRIRELRECF